MCIVIVVVGLLQGALARRVIVRIPFEEILGKNKRNWESALYFQERVEKLSIPEDPVESVVAAMDIGAHLFSQRPSQISHDKEVSLKGAISA